jgi:hypothetical protein
MYRCEMLHIFGKMIVVFAPVEITLSCGRRIAGAATPSIESPFRMALTKPNYRRS